MKIILAFDSFKGSIDSPRVCELAEKKILEVHPDCSIKKMPLADGGENTASILAEFFGGGMKIIGNVQGPIPQIKVFGAYGNIPSQKTAIIEMAIASGLALLDRDELKPLESNTFGTGEILNEVFKSGYEQVYLTLGGSATNDGGTGAAAALGWKFFDKDDKPIIPCGGNLIDIARIEAPANSWHWPKVKCLCDVQNPLTGPNGAAAIYGPQKGADKEDIKLIDDGLKNLAEIMRRDFGKEIDSIPGAGAAGGFGGGAIGFFNAELVPGIETILNWMNFAEELKDTDWVITGEGCLDDTSFKGKVLSGISKSVANSDAKLAAIAGRIKASGKVLSDAGVEIAEACAPSMIPDKVAFEHAEELFQEAASRVAERIKG
ncbi:MAG: glycerate kinase [Lentisphaeraceae bacterium]|nr:glycerate kinase [Lentisphaeraceae bacterium]